MMIIIILGILILGIVVGMGIAQARSGESKDK